MRGQKRGSARRVGNSANDMEGQAARAARVVFERFVFDHDRRMLLRDGKSVVLHGKAFELLAILVASHGIPVSRDDLYARLWPDSVVEDGNLTQAVYLLRRALDPSGTGRRYIETLPRFGYRFTMSIHVAQEGGPAAPRRSRGLLAGAAAATCAALLLFGGSAVRSTTIPLDPQASISYSLGVFHLNMRTPDEIRHSVDYFMQTVQEAPRSAVGYAGLASAYGLLAEYESVGSSLYENLLALARRNSDRALALGQASADAHAVAAFLAYRFDDDPALADREFRLAFAADPNDAAAHHWHAIYLFSHGQIESAQAEWELAHQLDPTSEVISRWLGRAYVYERRPDDAIRALSETLAIQPSDAPAWLSLASAQEQRGKLRDALQTLEIVRRRMPYENAYVIPDEARIKVLLRRGGDGQSIADVQRLIAKGQADAVETSLFYVALGSRDRAIAELQTAHPANQLAMYMEEMDPRFDSLRSDPRFQRLFD